MIPPTLNKNVVKFGPLMECLHDPANVQQTFSKHPAGLMEPHPLSAYQLPTSPPISCGLSPRRA